MKRTRSSNKEKEKEEFTRPVTVYIGFSDHEEEETTEKEIPSQASKQVKRQANLKPQLKSESLSLTQTTLPTQLAKKQDNEKLIGQKREADRKEEIKVPSIKKVQKVTDETVPTQRKNLAIRSPTKFTEIELFNKDFKMFEDIEIAKKPEFVEKNQLEKFSKSYGEFLQVPEFKKLTDEIIKTNYWSENSGKLYKLYHFVEENSGFENVICNLLFNNFLSSFNFYTKYEEVRKDYDLYLYHYALYSSLKNKSNHSELEKICERNPKVILEVPVINYSPTDSDEEVRKKIDSALKYDIAILRGFLEHFELNNKVFSIDYLRENKSLLKNKIDVIEQSTEFVGFSRNRHTRLTWTLEKYLNYVNEKQQEKPASKGKSSLDPNPSTHSSNAPHKNKHVYYGVNVELSDYPKLYDELENQIHPLLLFGSSYDALAYVRQHIKGMTIPQMYIKVKDVWTGGHEENLRMRSINISHGPGESLWWSTPVEDSEKLVRKVEDLYQMNIYKKEGIWFPEPDFFFRNDIRMFYTNQKAGDIVLVGSGAIHWVKAKSHAINTSWNFSHKDSYSLKLSMDRYNINKKIHFRSLVPMNTLILDILNHEMISLDYSYIETCKKYIIPTINESIKELNSIKDELSQKDDKHKIALIQEPDEYLVQNCEECLNETFNCWGYCDACSKKEQPKVLCVKCFKSHLKTCMKPQQQFYFYKYEEEALDYFKKRLEFRSLYENGAVTLEKEIKEIQSKLVKNTKDSQMINQKKLTKIEIPESFKIEQDNYFLYKECDFNQISSFLIPCVDMDQLLSSDFKFPLEAEKEKKEDPYIDFEDYAQDENRYKFSPVRDPDASRKNSYEPMEEDNEINSFNNSDPMNNGYFNLANQGALDQNNIYKDDMRISISNNNQKYNTYMQPSIAIYNNPKIYNFHNNIKGKSFISSLIHNDEKSIHSSRSISKEDQPEKLSANSNFVSLVKDVPNVKKLKNDLVSESPADKKLSVSGIFNNLSKSLDQASSLKIGDSYMPNNPFQYDMKKESSEAICELNKAKKLLQPLIDREKCRSFKFISETEHRAIFDGKNMVLKHLDDKKALEDTKMKTLIEKIVNNHNLIADYRTLFEEEIYSRII